MTQQLTSDFQNSLKIQDSQPTTHPYVPREDQQEHEQEQELVTINDDEDDEEFSFSCGNRGGSPISPSSAFRDGQIRPMFPLFDTSLLLAGEPVAASSSSSSSSSSSLKKLFSGDRVEAVEEVTVSSEACKKSNSTGHSRVWKFRDLMTTMNRSNSDGKDAFVFLKNGHNNERERGKSEKVAEKKKSKRKTASSAHEKLYVKNRERKEDEKRKSYLPYRQGLVGLGFFTNVNHGLSRNMHPY